jgi:DNA-binding Lrp family transcriptional regulator
MAELSDTDRRLLRALREHPRASVTELARRLGVARGTVYTRLERLESSGVLTGHGPDVDPRAAGLSVVAFVNLEIEQGAHAATLAHLRAVPEILQIHTITGDGDLLCWAIATSNDHMHDVLQRITAHAAVIRSRTQLALHSEVVRSVADVVASLDR